MRNTLGPIDMKYNAIPKTQLPVLQKIQHASTKVEKPKSPPSRRRSSACKIDITRQSFTNTVQSPNTRRRQSLLDK